MTHDILKTINDHGKWLRREEGGICADLSGADLRGSDLSSTNLQGANLQGAYLQDANLQDAKLIGAIGNKIEVFSLQLDTWPVTYTKDVLQIGCQRHALSDWWGFSDAEIMHMERRALAWWRKWKPVLKQLVEMTVGEQK